jgi:hypothetical protein
VENMLEKLGPHGKNIGRGGAALAALLAGKGIYDMAN